MPANQWATLDKLGKEITKLAKLSNDAVMANSITATLNYLDSISDQAIQCKSTLIQLKSSMIKKSRKEN